MGVSSIEWTDYTFNPWIGCAKITDGCRNCYAERENGRFGRAVWGVGGRRHITSDDYWKQPLRWNTEAAELGIRYRVFSASMADVFENHPDVVDARARLFALIRATPHLDWLLLTKRPENIARLLPSDWGKGYPNVWLGTSVEDSRVRGRIPHLLANPAPVHFLSCEPLIGDPQLRGWLNGVDWVIAGGESGHSARPMHPWWLRDLRDSCVDAGVAFFFKQWGEWKPICEIGESDELYYPAPERDPEARRRPKVRTEVLQLDGTTRLDFPKGAMQIFRLGKKRAGRDFDGRTWDEYPIVGATA
jgi:protein gp37